MNDFTKWSYGRHESHCSSTHGAGDVAGKLTTGRYASGTVGVWRHERMYHLLDALLESYPNSRWLTVGDAHGTDAAYLQRHGSRIVATDISDSVLRAAHAQEHIEAFQRENAEELSFEDGEFDFVFCKESYHHFPRPMLALYEMLRVARKGVVLIEPWDRYLENTPPQLLFRGPFHFVIRRFFGLPMARHMYEGVGNYVYSISKREIEKAALGINCRAVAFSGINDYFDRSAQSAPAESGSRPFRKTRFVIGVYDLLVRLGLVKYRYLCAIVLKDPPSDATRGNLRRGGFKVTVLPENPYLANPDSPPASVEAFE